MPSTRYSAGIWIKDANKAFPNAPSWLVAPSSTSARELQIMFCSGSAAAYSCLQRLQQPRLTKVQGTQASKQAL